MPKIVKVGKNDMIEFSAEEVRQILRAKLPADKADAIFDAVMRGHDKIAYEKEKPITMQDMQEQHRQIKGKELEKRISSYLDELMLKLYAGEV